MSKENSIGEDIAVIKEKITNLSNNFEEYKKDNKVFCEKITRQVNDTENLAVKNGERINNMSVFQIAFSTIASAIAGYLGVRK